MKNLIYKTINNIKLMVIIYITTLLIASWMFMYFEHTSFNEAIYWAGITALSIGYGDVTPHTTVMRYFSLLFANFWLLVMIPVVISHFIMKAIEDKDAFTNEEQEELKRNITLLLEKLESK